MTATLTGVEWYLKGTLICISWMARDAEHSLNKKLGDKEGQESGKGHIDLKLDIKLFFFLCLWLDMR